MPNFIPIDDAGATEGAIISKETMTSVAAAISYLLDSVPVGRVVPILVDWPNVPTPNPDLWQACNGTPVLNPHSPLYGQLTPDLLFSTYYPKGAPTAGQAGQTAGVTTKNVAHDHGGVTGDKAADSTNKGQFFFGTVYFSGKTHAHSINSELGTVSIQPAHVRIKYYIKIL